MENLTDQELVNVYMEAHEANLKSDFVHVLKKEIDRRGLCLDNFDLSQVF